MHFGGTKQGLVFPDGGGIVESRAMHQRQLPWPCLALYYATSRREDHLVPRGPHASPQAAKPLHDPIPWRSSAAPRRAGRNKTKASLSGTGTEPAHALTRTTPACAVAADGDGRPRADSEPNAGAPEPSPSTEARVPAEWSHGPGWSPERSNGAGPTSPPVVSLCLSGCCCPFGPASLETTHRGS